MIEEDLEAIFLVRQLQTRRSYSLNGPTIQQLGAGGGTTIQFNVAATATTEVRAEVVIRDQTGNVVADSKAERIAADARAISDSANELVHLYEVRDALAKHYAGEENARAALCISAAEWKRLGALATAEPLEQGRHRDKHVGGLRRATAAELEEARGIVRNWITALAGVIT